MDAPLLLGVDLALAVDGVPQHVEQAAQSGLAHRDLNAVAGGGDIHTPVKALAGAEHDATHNVATDVLSDFHDAAPLQALDLQGLIDSRQRTVLKLHVHHGTGDLNNVTCVQGYSSPFLKQI